MQSFVVRIGSNLYAFLGPICCVSAVLAMAPKSAMKSVMKSAPVAAAKGKAKAKATAKASPKAKSTPPHDTFAPAPASAEASLAFANVTPSAAKATPSPTTRAILPVKKEKAEKMDSTDAYLVTFNRHQLH